ncbi:putative transcriptional regulator [Aspergillus undulatus]|uniref:putative transcriptional regulator n=1 Tax=Aspergillus undulatus TaxID=1810928 RepID=UPI003CCD1807
MAPKYAVDSGSDSEVAQSVTSPQPSDKKLERALRDVVAGIFKTGKTEELTVKRVRLAAEKALQLEDGFFKSNGDWKARSDQIIKDEVEIQDAAPQNPDANQDEEESTRTPPSDTAKSTKRAKPKAPSTSGKRRKTSPESDVNRVVDDEDTEGETKKGTKQPKAAAKAKPEPSEEEPSDDADAGEEDTKPGKEGEAGGDSESEMSVVLDEEAQPKRQRQKKGTEKAFGKPKKKAPAKSKDVDADPNQAEIKRLQGWLIKCGIRKMWARELAPYDTPKAKIKHLKHMLKDAGMEGRYSLEKARQIKEERELREDLEMVQEGAKRWGKETADDGSDSGGPRKRLNRGRKALAFLESDEEETD